VRDDAAVEPFRSAFESAAIGMALVDLQDNRWMRVNRPLCEFLGYEQDELVRLTWEEVTHPDDLDADRDHVRRLLAGEFRSFQMEKRYIRRDGEVVWGLLCSSLVCALDGTPLYGIAQVQDVTEARRAAEALQESERLWRTVFSEARENVVIVCVDTRRILDSNPAFRDTLGYTADDLAGMPAEAIVEGSGVVGADVALVRRSGGGRLGERRLRRRDGSVVHVDVASATPIRYAGREAICVIAHDVTERRRVQDLLESRVATLSELAGLLTLDLPLDAVLDRVAEAAVAATSVTECTIALGEGGDRDAGLPIASRGRVLGRMELSPETGALPPDERVVMEAVAAQAAVAVENARLLAEARGTAALEERQRLSRELHDSVSQALYGIALGAQTARGLVANFPERAAEPLEFVVSLADAALAEMRALILALRPEALEEEGLVGVLRQEAEAAGARQGLAVAAELCDEPAIDMAAKEALYRIAHEALHNVIKHARAGHAGLRLREHDRAVTLEVWDDGAGFDTGSAFAGHLGLRSMRERAESCGGGLALESAPGRTVVRASLPARLPT
jgi:PAS domain S-box-containing protein